MTGRCERLLLRCRAPNRSRRHLLCQHKGEQPSEDGANTPRGVPRPRVEVGHGRADSGVRLKSSRRREDLDPGRLERVVLDDRVSRATTGQRTHRREQHDAVILALAPRQPSQRHKELRTPAYSVSDGPRRMKCHSRMLPRQLSRRSGARTWSRCSCQHTARGSRGRTKVARARRAAAPSGSPGTPCPTAGRSATTPLVDARTRFEACFEADMLVSTKEPVRSFGSKRSFIRIQHREPGSSAIPRVVPPSIVIPAVVPAVVASVIPPVVPSVVPLVVSSFLPGSFDRVSSVRMSRIPRRRRRTPVPLLLLPLLSCNPHLLARRLRCARARDGATRRAGTTRRSTTRRARPFGI